jgi:hypothetical protein
MTPPDSLTSGAAVAERQTKRTATPGGKMGRVVAGTRIAVRRATDEEIAVQWDKLHAMQTPEWNALTLNPADKHYEPNPDYRLQANVYLLCLEDEPESVLFSWWSPQGHWLLEYAVKEARSYARARGAEYVGLLMPQLWHDEADNA